MMHRPLPRRRVGANYARWIALTLAALGGCDLDVQSPTRVPAAELNDPARAPLLVQSVIADFECAFANYVATAALLTDELIHSTPFQLSLYDRRMISGSPVTNASRDFAIGSCSSYTIAPYAYGVYTPLSTARWYADSAYAMIEAFPGEDIPGGETARLGLLATAAAYAGYSYTLFGEGFCSAAFDRGPELDPPATLARAEQRFTTAIDLAQQGTNDAVLNLARVGRARVRLDLAGWADKAGDGSLADARRADAAADARLVAVGFVRYAARASGDARRENMIAVHNQGEGRVSVDPRIRLLTVEGIPDPRVQAVNAGTAGNDNITALWYQTKYTSRADPIRLASWQEAQLIIAEAEGTQSAVDRINDVRARHNPPLPLFSSGDSDEIMRQVARERRAELYLEGHRLNDRLRLPARLGVPATVTCPGCFDNLAEDSLTVGLAWETGRNHRNQTYGSSTAPPTTCLPLPNVERDYNDSIP